MDRSCRTESGSSTARRGARVSRVEAAVPRAERLRPEDQVQRAVSFGQNDRSRTATSGCGLSRFERRSESLRDFDVLRHGIASDAKVDGVSRFVAERAKSLEDRRFVLGYDTSFEKRRCYSTCRRTRLSAELHSLSNRQVECRLLDGNPRLQ